MLSLRFGSLGFIASTSVLLSAPVMPTNCAGGGAGGSSGSPPGALCGNGKLEAPEECDGKNLGRYKECHDANAAYPVGEGSLKCGSDCRLDTSECPSVCGDGKVDDGTRGRWEICDGYALGVSGYSCAAAGFVAGTAKCAANCYSPDYSECIPPVCGDGKREGYEECDGADLREPSCKALVAFVGGTLRCGNNCKYDFSGCVPPVCGDGVIEGFETCDPGRAAAAPCRNLGPFANGGEAKCINCVWNLSACTRCGNGMTDAGEECDPTDVNGMSGLSGLRDTICVSLGYRTGTISCGSDCKIDYSGCVTDAGCGNGVVDGNEKCEGANVGHATCASLQFTFPPGLTVGAGFTGGTLKCDRCGYDVSECTK